MIASKVRKWLGVGAIATIVAVAAGGAVLAQSGGGMAEPGDTPAGSGSASGSGSGSAVDNRVGGVGITNNGLGDTQTEGGPPSVVYASVDGPTMTANCSTMIHKMLDNLGRMVQVQQTARKQKDITKLNCVNDKLMQAKELVNIAEDNRAELTQAIARNDDQARYDYYSSVVIAFEKQSALASEAENCVGEDLSFIGPTETTTEGGDEPDDPTQPTGADFPEVPVSPIATPII
jgi:hypothetical protein